MSFLLEYLKHPKKIGAVAPSSKWLAKKMVESIRFDDCNCIIEYGPGTGVFTKEIIKRKKKDTLYLIIEQNKDFYLILKEKYEDLPNVVLIHGDAKDVEMYISQYRIQHVDYIISGLPFTSLPHHVAEMILDATNRVIRNEGKFITFQYTLLKRNFFKQQFEIEKITFEFKNLPPAYVFVMQNK